MGELLLLAAAGLLLYAAYMHLHTSFDFLPGDAMRSDVQPEAVADVKIQVLATAIGVAEGFGVAGTIPTRANNPGDLVIGDRGLGVLGEGITVFASADEGWAKLQKIVRGWLSGVSSVYSPDDSFMEVARKYVAGDSINWATNVVNFLNQYGGARLGVSSTLRDWVNS